MLDTTTVQLHNGTHLRVSVLGDGDCIILLHGYPENLQVFSKIAPALSASHKVIAFDWPGMGYSEEMKGGLTPLLMARRLKLFMDEWDIEKVHLIAQDMGVQPAMVFAAEYPDRVHTLVIMNALITDGASTSWEIKLLRKFKMNRLLLLQFPHLIFYRALITFLPFPYRIDAALRSDLWAAFQQRSVRQCIVRMCAGYEGQLKRLPEWYKKVKCPALILWGEHDKHFPPTQAEQLLKLIPHASFSIIKGGYHWMVLQKPEQVLQHLTAFYADLSNSKYTL